MALTEEQLQPEQPPAEEAAAAATAALPDYVTDPNAVMGDTNATWRYGKPPDYSNTRKVWAQTKQQNHAAGSLEEIVENLVKNWEVEASFKPVLSDWRTVDHKKYTFAINGGPPQTAEHMLKVGTYNAIIAPNQYYCPAHSDFQSSHKTFKRMMPTFAWEVMEVYSGPPKVAFRWRHWGVMKNDYVGFNDQGEKVTAKAHGGPIDIQGVTVAEVDDKLRLQSVMTWFDPLEMFRQIAPGGVVNKQTVNHKVGQTYDEQLDQSAHPTNGQQTELAAAETQSQEKDTTVDPSARVAQSLVCPILHTLEKAKQQVQELEASLTSLGISRSATTKSELPSTCNGHAKFDSRIGNGTENIPTGLLETEKAPTVFVETPYPHPHDSEDIVHPSAGEAVVADPRSAEAKETKAEMSQATGEEERGLLNVE